MVKITLQSQEEQIEIQAPTAWKDVTWAQYLQILNSRDLSDVGIIAILCNVSEDVLYSVNEEQWPKLASLFDFFFTPSQEMNTAHLPQVAEGNLRQFEDSKHVINTNDLHPYSAGAMVVAIYEQKNYGSDGYELAQARAKELEKMSVEYVLPRAAFFLNKSLTLQSKSADKNANMSPKNLMQALQVWKDLAV